MDDSSENDVHAGETLLLGTCCLLKIALAWSIESLRDILYHPNKTQRKILLSLDKHLENLCSYSTKQLGRLVNA